MLIILIVRNDLIKTFHSLFENPKLSLLDWVVIETTGLADPAPLIQSLYMDPTCKKFLRMDSILTVVDALHISLHLEDYSSSPDRKGVHGGTMEAIQQICFADKIIVNKIDLVDSNELSNLLKTIKLLNSYASVIQSVHSKVSVDELLNIRAFDPSKNKHLLEMLDRTYKSVPVFININKEGKIEPQKKTKSEKPSTELSTISLSTDFPIDLDSFNNWITQYLQVNGPNLYRFKGLI